MDRRVIRESSIPLAALYNKKIDQLKQYEGYGEVDPYPIILTVIKGYDGDQNHVMVRLKQENLNIVREHTYKVDSQPKVYRSDQEQKIYNRRQRVKKSSPGG
mmetsp:Transcript_13699/g.13416  ORF Transcript_13699/g.13416 Transcript_13699/m.13416 type:complete len:102 (+) Transcript_13699:82-387(+)